MANEMLRIYWVKTGVDDLQHGDRIEYPDGSVDTFNEITGRIDLSPLKNYKYAPFEFFMDGISQGIKTITEVGTNKNGISYFSYVNGTAFYKTQDQVIEDGAESVSSNDD